MFELVSCVVCLLWVDASPWMDDHGSSGRVGSTHQGTTSKVREVASSIRQKPTPAVRQSGAQGSKGPIVARPAPDPVRRVSPDLARVTAQERARKLEKALEVMSDVEGPAVEAIRVELKKAQNAAAVLALDVQIQQCESFITRSERRLAEIDAQRVAEEESTEAKARLERLRSEVIAEPSVPTDWETEVKKFRQQVAELQCQKPLYSRVQASHPVQSSVEAVQMVQERAAKRRACAEEVPSTEQALAEWLCSKHLELRDALEIGDPSVVAELSQLLAAGAVKMQTLSGAVSMVANSVR